MGVFEYTDDFSWSNDKNSDENSWHVFMVSWDFHGKFMVFFMDVYSVVINAA